MMQNAIHRTIGFLLLALMILVPTDLLRIGLNAVIEGESMCIMMEMELESEIDHEDKEKSKEKSKEKTKITTDYFNFLFGTAALEAHGSSTDKKSFGHPLAHYLEIDTPPPQLV